MLALITGASSGLGIEFARLLAINGYDLIISARRKDRLESLKKVLEKKYKINVKVFTADLSKTEDVLKLAGKIFINDIDVRMYGSQGQQRTASISLKLSEIELIKQEVGDYPVLILDDVFSELDQTRQKMLVEKLENIQMFVTSADPLHKDILDIEDYSIFSIENGRLIGVENGGV